MSSTAPPTGMPMGVLRSRLVRIAVAVLVAAAVLLVLPAPARGQAIIDPGPAKPIVFPVVGEVYYDDWFWAPRANGPHLAQDLMGEKMLPLVAADDGVVTYRPVPEPRYGWVVEITADDGWLYRYLHINNDTPGTDDGSADLQYVFGPGIEEGARVVAGQLVAFMGDSGNAEGTQPHLDFQMEDPSGAIVNPFQALEVATRLDAPVAVPGIDYPDFVGAGSEPVTVGDADEPDVAGGAGSGQPVPRLAGADRYGTAIAASRSAWPDGSDAVVLARGDRYAEALPASVLAGALDAPLLLVPPEGWRDDLGAELRRLAVREAFVVGGVPDDADAVFRWAQVPFTRLGPADDAVATAVAVANEVGGRDGTVVLVNRDRFADGVSAAALAAEHGWPILLSDRDTVPQASVDAWRALGATRVVLVGGPAVLGGAVEAFVPGGVRIAGADRYATSAEVASIAATLDRDAIRTVFLTTGTTYPDSLAAGALAARADGVVVLIDGSGSGSDGAAQDFLAARARSIDAMTVLGGTAAVSPDALARIGGATR